MEQALQAGFVVSDGLSIVPIGGGILIEGIVDCLGHIRIEVDKRLVFVDSGDDPLVQTTDYRYNVSIAGVGVMFRYDSPHPDHRQEHHVHRYDVLNGDLEGTIEFIYDEEERPVLAEIFEEASDWFFEHIEELQQRGIIPPGYPP